MVVNDFAWYGQSKAPIGTDSYLRMEILLFFMYFVVMDLFDDIDSVCRSQSKKRAEKQYKIWMDQSVCKPQTLLCKSTLTLICIEPETRPKLSLPNMP